MLAILSAFCTYPYAETNVVSSSCEFTRRAAVRESTLQPRPLPEKTSIIDTVYI
jgi:hypothetical protein